MKKTSDYYTLPAQEKQIVLVHVLADGTIILSAKELEPYEDKFAWVNIIGIERLIISLRPMTDPARKSIIVIFETGEIKQFPNVSKNFTDYTLLNKSGL